MALAARAVLKQDLKNRTQYSSAVTRQSFAKNYGPDRSRRSSEIDVLRSVAQPRIQPSKEDLVVRFVGRTRAPRTAEFKYSDDWQAWSRPAGAARSLEQAAEYAAILEPFGFNKYVESADKGSRTLGTTVRHSEANSLSTEELFSRLDSLNALSETPNLTREEILQMSEAQWELDERESSEPGPAAAIGKIDMDLARLDKISEILRLLSTLG
jgi:hypothetical protein